MPRLSLVAAVVVTAIVAGLAGHDAEARARRTTRTVRLKAADAAESAAGRMRFQTRRGATLMSASFAHLAPDTMHTVRWDAAGQDGGQFVTDHRGRAKLRNMAVPEGATGDVSRVSVVDENGDPVLTCDPDSMPGMHDEMPGDHQGMDGMMGDGSGMHGGSTTDGTDHASHHDGSTTGGSGSSGDGMMGSGGMHGGGGMMKK